MQVRDGEEKNESESGAGEGSILTSTLNVFPMKHKNPHNGPLSFETAALAL